MRLFGRKKREAEPEIEVEAKPAAKAKAKPKPKPKPKIEPKAEPEKKKKKKGGWFSRLKKGLSRSSTKISDGITTIFKARRLDAAAIEELEDLLITADLGPATAAKLAAGLAKRRFEGEVAPETVRAALAEDIAEILAPVAKPLKIDKKRKPHTILVVGVNGSGKTTTIGKFAKQYRDDGSAVTLVAGDTFRAAAVEQLQIWGERAGCPVIARETGADAAGLAYDALAEARERGDDVLMIDTAGRLQNKADLMAELQKIIRALRKLDPAAPDSVLLVLDATIGQNAHSQVEIFLDLADISGLVITKLDGSAKGGVLVALADRFGLPVHAIGVGEEVDDLRPFEADDFARSLMGL